MTSFLKSFEGSAYALLRIVSGFLFSFHGVQKVFGVLTTDTPAIGSQLWLGGLIELVAGFAIGLGYFTPIFAFVASGTMAVAYTQFHWKLGLGAQLFPAINEGELALVYTFVFLFLATRGNGKWSVQG